MRRDRPSALPSGPRLGPVAALAGSLLGHGAVLAALLGQPVRPPAPLPAVTVAIVALAPATESTGPGPGTPVPPSPVAAPAAPAEPAAPPLPEAAGPPPAPPVATPRAGPPAGPRRKLEAAAERVRPRPRPPPASPRAASTPSEPPEAASAAPVARPAVADAVADEAGRADAVGAAAPAGAPAPGIGEGSRDRPAGWVLGSPDNPAPRYPSVARRRGIEGTVTLAVLVSAQGLASEVQLARSSGSTLLDEAALEAVRRWRFLPALAGGRAVEARVLVPIAFRLVDPPGASLALPGAGG